jgi:hypothetical protein
MANDFINTGKRIEWAGFDCDVWLGSYVKSGAPALALMERGAGEDVVVASVNLSVLPPTGCVWIKDWTENEGMLAALVAAGVVEDTGMRRETGFCEAALCRLLVPERREP